MENSENKLVRKRRHLTPEEKHQIFIEATMAKAGNGSISEVLRRWGIHSSDLTRIRAAVEEGAVTILKSEKAEDPRSIWNSMNSSRPRKNAWKRPSSNRPPSWLY